MDWIAASLGIGAGGATLWVLKMIPNEKIYGFVEKSAFGLGRLMTLGLASDKSPLKKIWNEKIEPWFIDLIQNTFGAFVHGIIRGLKVDK
ncbi:MAG: hypothetical protein Unbinned5336contig1001_31 [Prokaryotic dsDNA virus sp.]|nr:MAG: hypothetical protein Unbinned5336contig1001_31 [Prokaryotic dsDNA virus sp.]|tara:strand:- start:577 stop:846 length:270 start_codon:yes stop_codon:yes gene_type:complete